MRPVLTLLTLSMLILLSGCQDETPQQVKIPPQAPQHNTLTQPPTSPTSANAAKETSRPGEIVGITAQTEGTANTGTSKEEQSERTPPRPPILEDFQRQPQLSLFPRVGDYQPELDSDRHPYWRTFIDHLVKVTGVAENQEDGSRGWVFRSVNTIDSLGYFAPLAVEPSKSYQVTFNLMAELPEGATAGIGVLEFNEFLWIGEQYTEETFKKHYRGVHEGKRLTGKAEGKQVFSFTTGPDTAMIHLVLFRDGAHDRNALMFDNIEIK